MKKVKDSRLIFPQDQNQIHNHDHSMAEEPSKEHPSSCARASGSSMYTHMSRVHNLGSP